MCVGCQQYVATGSSILVGVPWARDFGLFSAYGIGGNTGMGSGDIIHLFCPTALVYGIVATDIVGGQKFLGAGELVMIGSPSTRDSGIFFRGGQGTVCFVGAGDLLVLYSPDIGYGALGYAIGTGGFPQYKFVVNGANYNPPARQLGLDVKETSSLPSSILLTQEASSASSSKIAIIDSPSIDKDVLPTWEELQAYTNDLMNKPDKLVHDLEVAQVSSDPNFVYVGEGYDSCSICPFPENAESVGGPSAQTCSDQSSADQCSDVVGSSSVSSKQSKAMVWSDNLTGSYIIKATMTIDSNPTPACDGVTCTEPDDSKAIKAWLKNHLDALGAKGVKVSVDSGAVDPLFTEFMQSPKRTLEVTKGLVADYHVSIPPTSTV